MLAHDLDYTYTYRGPSSLTGDSGRRRLSLVTTPGGEAGAQFFRGFVTSPKRTADLLLTVVEVVGSRFHVPPAMLAKILRLADPVITCSDEQLRFEGFSACCGAYARLDLLPNAVDGERMGSGTTNVDVNAPTRAALSRLRDGESMEVGIGADGLTVTHSGDTLVERKVKLPSRWLRGFVEVQACQARLRPRLELDGGEFRRFLRELPRAFKGIAYVSGSRRNLRLSTVPGPDAVAVGGVARLRVLEPIARYAETVRVYAGVDGDAVTGWELETPDSRFHLVLSPEVWRGFSGEGQVLETLAMPARERALTLVKASLRWQGTIDPDALVAANNLDRASVEWALAQCAASGLVGYDLNQQAYFHRELPFDVGLVHKLQPRLAATQKLVEQSAVTFDKQVDSLPGGVSPIKAWVRSRDVEYRVTIEGDSCRCNCPWFAKHGMSRGPCKHILAVQTELREGGGDVDAD